MCIIHCSIHLFCALLVNMNFQLIIRNGLTLLPASDTWVNTWALLHSSKRNLWGFFSEFRLMICFLQRSKSIQNSIYTLLYLLELINNEYTGNFSSKPSLPGEFLVFKTMYKIFEVLEEQYCYWYVDRGMVWVREDLKDLLVLEKDQNQSFLLDTKNCACWKLSKPCWQCKTLLCTSSLILLNLLKKQFSI